MHFLDYRVFIKIIINNSIIEQKEKSINSKMFGENSEKAIKGSEVKNLKIVKIIIHINKKSTQKYNRKNDSGVKNNILQGIPILWEKR